MYMSKVKKAGNEKVTLQIRYRQKGSGSRKNARMPNRKTRAEQKQKQCSP